MRVNALLGGLVLAFLILSAGVSFAAIFGIQILADAFNPETLECQTFGSPQSVPSGWVKIESCNNIPTLTAVNKNITFTNSSLQILNLKVKKWADVSSLTVYMRGYQQDYAEYILGRDVRLPLHSRPWNAAGSDWLTPSDTADVVYCDSTGYNVYCNTDDFTADISMDMSKVTAAQVIVNGHAMGYPPSDMYYFVNREKVWEPTKDKYSYCPSPFPDSSVSYRCNTTQWGLVSGFEHTGSYKTISMKSGTLKQGKNVFSFSDSQKDPGMYVDNVSLRLDTSNIDAYPSDVKIDFDGDGFSEALANGNILGQRTVEIPIGTVLDALDKCTADEKGICTIPVSFSSGNIGILNVMAYELKEKQEVLNNLPEEAVYLNKSLSFSGKNEILFLNLPKGKTFETFDIYLKSEPKNYIEYKLSGSLNPALKSSITGYCEDNLDNYCDYSDFNITIDKSKISSVGLVINAEALTNANGNLFYFLNRACSVVGQSYICGSWAGKYTKNPWGSCNRDSDCHYTSGACEGIDGLWCNGQCYVRVTYWRVAGSYPTYDCTFAASNSLSFPYGNKTIEVPLSLSTLNDGLNTISVAEDAKDGVPMYVNYIGLKTYVPPTYVSDLSVDFVGDGEIDDFLYGTQTGWVKVSIPAETVNSYLENCDGNETCEVPIVFNSSTMGNIGNIALYAQEEPLFTPASNPFILASGEGSENEFDLAGDATAFAQENPLLSLLLFGGTAAAGVALTRRSSIGDWIGKINAKTSQEIETENQPTKSFEEKFAESTSTSKYWKELEKIRLEREREREAEARREASAYRAQRRAETNAKWAALGIFPKPEPQPELKIERNPNSIYFPRPEPPVKTVILEPKAYFSSVPAPEVELYTEQPQKGFWGKLKDKAAGFVGSVQDGWNKLKQTANTAKGTSLAGNLFYSTMQIAEFQVGVVKSVYNTVKGLVYDLPKVVYNVGKAGYEWAITSEDHWGDVKGALGTAKEKVEWVASHPDEVKEKVKELAHKAWDYCSGSAENAGECVGEVAQLFVGGGAVGGAAKAGKAGSLAGKAGKAANAAGKIGKGVETAGKLGKAGNKINKVVDAKKAGTVLKDAEKGLSKTSWENKFQMAIETAGKGGIEFSGGVKAPKLIQNMAKKEIEKLGLKGWDVEVGVVDTITKEGKNVIEKEFIYYIPGTKKVQIILTREAITPDNIAVLKHAVAHPFIDTSEGIIVAENILKENDVIMKSSMRNIMFNEAKEELADLVALEYGGETYLNYLKKMSELGYKYDKKVTLFGKQISIPIEKSASKKDVQDILEKLIQKKVRDEETRQITLGLLKETEKVKPVNGIYGKAGHAGLPVMSLPWAGGVAAARAAKIPEIVETILVKGEKVTVSRAVTDWSGRKISSDTLTNLQKSHLGMIRGEIGKGARNYNVKLGNIEYRDFGKNDAWARSSYDTLFIDQKTSAAELIRRGTISHEFAHMEVAQKRFARKLDFNYRPVAFKKSYLAELEADALINVRDGENVFRNRVELLVEESKADDAAKLLDGVKINQREIENVVANELLAIRTGDELLIRKSQGISKLLVDKGLITREQYAQLQISMNNWLKNTIDKGRIGNKAAAEERIAELFDIFKSPRGVDGKALSGNFGGQISKDVKVSKAEGFVIDKPRSIYDRAADKVKNFFGKNNVI
ncbi:MAG: hypothetical protein HY362_02575 [Candidatus Aenigmarchaeota archaeon]|nr:hypothetical protein [Candidatus Aenigmarchaeota archaeon]